MNSLPYVTQNFRRRCPRVFEAVHSQRLLTCGEDLNSCLISACFLGNTDIVETLLDHGASPDATDANGRTALSIARRYKYFEIVRLLSKAQE